MGVIVMNKKEQKLYIRGLSVIHGKLKISEFSTLINKSYRQSQRIIKKKFIKTEKSYKKRLSALHWKIRKKKRAKNIRTR